MAIINIYPKEITEILNKNIQSKYLENFKCEEQMLLFDVKTGIPLIEKVPITIEFLRFEDGKAFFEAKSNYTLDKLLALPFVKDKIEKQLNYRHLDIDFPLISFNINAQLKEKTKSLKIDSIFFTEEHFQIKTNIKNIDFKDF